MDFSNLLTVVLSIYALDSCFEKWIGSATDPKKISGWTDEFDIRVQIDWTIMYCSQYFYKEICEGAISTLKFQGNFILQTADRQNHELPTLNEGINQKYVKIWANVVDKIWFGRT